MTLGSSAIVRNHAKTVLRGETQCHARMQLREVARSNPRRRNPAIPRTVCKIA